MTGTEHNSTVARGEIDPDTAISAGLALCHVCKKVLPSEEQDELFCPRCGARVHLRKTDSMARTWAFLITAAILLFPANLLPIMRVNHFGVYESSTILDGIIYFFQDGSYGIGLIILVASILVPAFKIVGIGMVLLSVHFRWQSWSRHKTLMFRGIEFVGRWSMLDIFVVALLQAIVDFAPLTSVEVGPGARYFTGVVLFTLFATVSFDLRLIWDI